MSDSDGVICFAAVDYWYHNRAHSEIQLMTRLAKRVPVLFVNSIGMRLPTPSKSTNTFGRIVRKAKSILRPPQRPISDDPNFVVWTPFIIPFYSSKVARRLNAWSVRAQTRRIARMVGIKDPSIFVTIPTAWDVVRAMEYNKLVYNRSDKHSAFLEADAKVIEPLEHSLMHHADAILYVSHELMRSEYNFAGERAVFLDHGVDIDLFQKRMAEPEDIAKIPKPRIGFFGSVNNYTVDVGLFDALSKGIPEASVVVVGHSSVDLTNIGNGNFYFLGSKPYDAIPAYGSAFDVAIMPWQRNDWIKHSNPIKMKEYLALDLPVVSTEFPEVHRYASAIRIASDAETFIELVREELGNKTQTERRSLVINDTWDKRAATLAPLLNVNV